MQDSFLNLSASIRSALTQIKQVQSREPKPERVPKPEREPRTERVPKPDRVRNLAYASRIVHPSPTKRNPPPVAKAPVDASLIEQAKALWKHDHPGMTLKAARRKTNGRIDREPWQNYLDDPRLLRRRNRAD